METVPGVSPIASGTPTERDPLGMRHQLANLVMSAIGLEGEAKDPDMRARYFVARVTGVGLLAICDVLGSMLVEVRQFRNWSLRRPPKTAVPPPGT